MKAIICFFLLTFQHSIHANTVEVMFYNLHNLFDTEHDEGKNDWQYLPKSHPLKMAECNKITGSYKKYCLETDWTKERLDMKLNQLKKVITSSGKLPDILNVCEIENMNVAKMLAKKLGYQYVVMTNSPDNRGIDLATFFNQTDDLKVVRYLEHKVTKGKMFEKKPTRNILEVQFKVKDQDLSIFVNHWPSQANPDEKRVIAAKTMKKVAMKRMRKGYKVISLGDFNTVDTDFPHAFNRVVFSGSFFRPKKQFFYDVDKMFRADRSIDKNLKNSLPLGTYFYAPKMSWDMLDRIFVSENLMQDDSKLKIDLSSYRILNQAQFTKNYQYTYGVYKGSTIVGAPMKSSYTASSTEKAGFSDHFAVKVNLNYE